MLLTMLHASPSIPRFRMCRDISRRLPCRGWCWLLLLLSIAGCSGQPQMARGNRELIESLRTAVSSRKVDWLEMNAALLEERKTKSQITDDEYTALHEIVVLAQNGDWEEAEEQVIALHKAQRLTDADREAVRGSSPGHHD